MTDKSGGFKKPRNALSKNRVVVDLSEDIYEGLSNSAKASGRTIRKEALIRIADHLDRFSIIGALGQTIPRVKHDV
ncbi:TraY domain-containing protein [Enterobacter asburiae]|uniref:TraY domain-containing protein n=1 Tax=Enterobacter asburiae TaxID=61645 RepID=UPI00192A9A96|nr:TraY domain-containing protein [Enterobacter asburiae]